MKHIKLDPQTNNQYVDMTLYLEDVKILYNACVDILNQHPEMIGYQRTAQKLQMVIQEQENNPYIQCGELEDSLNRNQRDVLDYYMMNLKNRAEMDINGLLDTIKWVIQNYDGKVRMSDEEIENFWAVLN
jgi:hypothetical protein